MAAASGLESENAADRRRGAAAIEIAPAGVDAVISNSSLRVTTRVSAKKSEGGRQRPQLLGPRGAQRGLDPPLRLLPQRSRALQRFRSGWREPHRRLALVFRRAQAHEPKLFQRLHVAPDRRSVKFRE